MRIAVISDIHGNYEALLRVLEDITGQGADRIISLGDNIGYGADSDKVIQTLQAMEVVSIRGNHEMAVLDTRVRSWFKPEARAALDIAIDSLSPGAMAYIRDLDPFLSFEACYFVHGFPPDSARVYLFQAGEERMRKALNRLDVSACFVGHTHRLSLVYPRGPGFMRETPVNGTHLMIRHLPCFINAGSVGQPRDGSTKAQYVIWDTRLSELTVRILTYDAATAARKIRDAGIPGCYARILEGGLTG